MISPHFAFFIIDEVGPGALTGRWGLHPFLQIKNPLVKKLIAIKLLSRRKNVPVRTHLLTRTLWWADGDTELPTKEGPVGGVPSRLDRNSPLPPDRVVSLGRPTPGPPRNPEGGGSPSL